MSRQRQGVFLSYDKRNTLNVRWMQPQVFAYAKQTSDGFVLQDDNARPHRARVVDQHLQENGIYRAHGLASLFTRPQPD